MASSSWAPSSLLNIHGAADGSIVSPSPPQVEEPPSTPVLSLFSDESVAAACLEYLNMTLSFVSETTPRPSAVAEPNSRAPTGGGMMMCLASVLESLSECDEKTVFSVRKINKLGFRSHAALKKYFSQFGTVVAIFFLPYRYKPDTASIRPSSMAFIHMGSREAVSAIFATGEVHVIRDSQVTVQPFTRASSSPH